MLRRFFVFLFLWGGTVAVLVLTDVPHTHGRADLEPGTELCSDDHD